MHVLRRAGLVEDTDVLPIGKPYPHYEVFLLSEQNEAVPNGEIGEICVKGPILALGYYNSREKTAESFLQNPLNRAYDERIYKTGDLGHFAPDGNLMFHGRKDRQVKHLGHRVELGEIDLAAAKVSGVEEACALYDQEHEQIWLFYTGADVTKRDIAVALRADLPGFMVPRKIEPAGRHAPARQRQDGYARAGRAHRRRPPIIAYITHISGGILLWNRN